MTTMSLENQIKLSRQIRADLALTVAKMETLNTSADWTARQVKPFHIEVRNAMKGGK